MTRKLTGHIQPDSPHGDPMTAVVPRLHVLEVVDVVYFVDVGVDYAQPVAVVVTQDNVI